MTVVDLHRSASENLLETYFALGAASDFARITREDGYRLCLGWVDHPICNFAADLDLNPNSARQLAEYAASRVAFHVYSVSGDRSRHSCDLLRCAGFRVRHRLTQMVFHSQQIDDPFPTVDLRLADLPQKRQAIAAFMTEQFFSCQGGAFRRRVAEATARAWSLTLLTVLDREQMIGAVMLSEQPGTLGLYNLCVASAHRNRGWGQEIVRAVKKKAAMVAKPIILQCEPSLEAWYAKQGFKSSGYVDVFCLEQVP